MTFGRTGHDSDSPADPLSASRGDHDAPYGGARADGFGSHRGNVDGFGGTPLAVRSVPDHGGAVPSAGGATSTLGSALLRSAASDLERVRARVGPGAQLIPRFALDASQLARELEAIVRRVDEATTAGGVRGGDVENFAGALRAFELELPPQLRDTPEILDAMAVLSSALGDVASASGVRPSPEPTSSLPAMPDDRHAQLARRLITDASTTLDTVDKLPPGAGEHEQYARAASSAATQLAVAADLVATHVPPGKARMALGGTIEQLSARIARVDQWARASRISSDPSIAGLFRSEAQLRQLVGLDEAHRAPLATVDAETTARALTTEHAGSARGGTVGHVRAALNEVLEAMRDAIDTFAAGVESDAPPSPTLMDDLITLAVETALGSSFEGALKRTILTIGRSIVGSDGDGPVPGKVLDVVWKHGMRTLRSSGVHRTSEANLSKAYLEALREKMRGTSAAIRGAFEDEADRLAHASPDSLRELTDAMHARVPDIGHEALVQYILSWQTVKTRNDQGTPERPHGGAIESRPEPSVRDAALAPGFAAAPGVLRVAFPVVGLTPRASMVAPGSGHIDGITSAHGKALHGADARPLRDLRLNTAIRVTLGAVQLGGVEILWFPDGETVKVNWERRDLQREPLSEARHLAAYARGLPVNHPDLELASEEDALTGAHMIAERVMSADTKWVLG